MLRRIIPLQENRESPCRNACLWPKSYARLRKELKAPFLVVTGVMSRRDGAYNLVVEKAKPMYVIPDPPESRNFHWGVRLVTCDRGRGRGLRRDRLEKPAAEELYSPTAVDTVTGISAAVTCNCRPMAPRAASIMSSRDRC